MQKVTSMKITIHQTHQSIADFDAIFNYLEEHKDVLASGVHLFPELFIGGYPLQDLCLQKSFVQTYQKFLKKLALWCKNNLPIRDCCLLLGGLDYELTSEGTPIKIRNVIFQFGDQKELQVVYTKRLLPNYDIFDEKKYFFAGDGPGVLDIFSKKIGILICEDMWPSNIHKFDPVLELKEHCEDNKITLDAIFNFSASPYNRFKYQKRQARASEISHLLECPFYYVNKVGAEDEIIFDGRSFVFNADELLVESKRFSSDIIKTNLFDKSTYKRIKLDKDLTWEQLFAANLEKDKKGVKVSHMDDNECQEILEALCFGFQEYAQKNGFNSFTIALSGGIDSSLVLAIVCLSLKKDQYLEAIYMPSIYSSPLSYELSLNLCQNLNIPFRSLPIKFLHSTAKNLFTSTFSENFEGLTDENIQARLRGMLLYTRSNQINSMVVNTSNKSELAVGYSTQYGDSVGAISLLGDLYKSEVFCLARYINKKFNQLIPEQIIERPPTAELRENQTDEQSLPPYEELDAILEGFLSYRYDLEGLVKAGFEREKVQKVLELYRKSEYKRYQFCPILKINSKSFGFGYRIPLSKDSRFYIK